GLYAANDKTGLLSLLNAVTSMQANFTQVIYDNHGQVVQKAFGRMSLQRPGKFRWEVTKPIPQIIIANEQKLWIYDPDLEQVTIRALGNTQSETPALLLSHVDSRLADKFVFSTLPNAQPGWRWYQLTPKQQDSMFAWIKMGFQQGKI